MAVSVLLQENYPESTCVFGATITSILWRSNLDPNWGNSSQIKQMKANFQSAIETLSLKHPGTRIIAVNGCMYGIDPRPQKDGYLKLCGQSFWELISASTTLYTDIIEPLGHQAKIKNDEFEQAYARLVNRFVAQFIQSFCHPNGAVDWERLVRWTSQRLDTSP